MTAIHRVAAAVLALAAIGVRAEITPESLDEAARAVEPRLIAWRRDLHQHPELSNREFRTAKLVAEHLRGLGLEVREGIAHTGVAAVLRGGRPGPTIALRADMDALPVTEQVDLPFKSTVTTEYGGQVTGVMHACGHDAHTAILMAAAEVLAARRDELPGAILFVFQPAEEGAPEGERGGASLMLDEGLFDIATPEAAFGLHVHSSMHAGVIGYRPGPFMAGSDFFRIVVKGKQTHGAQPWNGVDPIVVAAQIVGGLQTIVSRNLELTEQPGIERAFAEKDVAYLEVVPLREGCSELLDIVQLTDFGDWVMVKAGNMKLTFDKESGIIVNTSGGGCPDVPHLATEMLGKRLRDAPNPGEVGFSLCAYSLNTSREEIIKMIGD